MTHEFLIRVYRDLEKVRDEAHIAGWISRITVNACGSHRRKHDGPLVFLEEMKPDQQIIDVDPNPEEELINEEEKIQLQRLISKLRSSEAQAVTLCYYENRSYKEIAELMNVPPGTVAILLHRGRVRLHVLMASRNMEDKGI